MHFCIWCVNVWNNLQPMSFWFVLLNDLTEINFLSFIHFKLENWQKRHSVKSGFATFYLLLRRLIVADQSL